MATGRGWGLWSQVKLKILGEYLDRFTTASKSTTETVYLDLFAGRTENFARTTGEAIIGSARVALAIDHPPFTRLRFFELPDTASRLEADLNAAYPGRDIRVYAGDCNVTIRDALHDLKDAKLDWAPTFAFVDPDGPDCHWSTLEALTRHKPASSKTKVEFWLLFPTMFMRQLPLDGRPLRADDVDQITAMFGSDQWREIHELRKADVLAGREARHEYTNLMRWRIENVLGYAATHPLEIPNERGVPIYTMIFATDHAAGTNIMTSLYRHAAQEFPVMRVQSQRIRAKKAREEAGAPNLFDALGLAEDVPDPASLPLGDYTYEPPSTPPGSIA